MSESLYTKREAAQFRGPTTSDNYNQRQEDVYKDLVLLANKIGLTEENVERNSQRDIKQVFSVAKMLESLEERVEALELDIGKLSFKTTDQVDNDRFTDTPYEVPEVNQCLIDSRYGLVLLPHVDTSSVSKILFTNSDGSHVLPSSFESLAHGISGTADTNTAFIDTSDTYNAVLPGAGKIWERNVIVDAPHANGAEAYLYVRIPTEASVTADVNCIKLDPFPVFGCDLMEVAYTTAINVSLNESDVYYPIYHPSTMHSGNANAVGWIPPGNWSGDEITNCGPKAFYFDPKPITGIRIKLRQKNYFKENGKYVYSYGLSKLDVRYDKFLDEGKTLLRFDAPSGETISSINNVTPQIWNVSESEAIQIFSYRVIWEVAGDGGFYTTTPVPLSNRVWIEVTLNKTIKSGSPVLSGLVIDYS